jgi:hypothetical protein
MPQRLTQMLTAQCSRLALGLVVFGLSMSPAVDAQTRTTRPPASRTARPAPLPALKTEAPMIVCPNPLGQGVQTQRTFCDVLTGRDPADGIVVDVPPHLGTARISFDLHNRHMYSEELIKSNRAYRRYTATIGVLTMDNTLLSRAVVQSEFRTASDLVDRIGGGAGPGGVKAVAPTGTEPISIDIPEAEQRVSILGEKLIVDRLDGVDNFLLPGQPVAIISNVMLEYRPAPPRRTPARRR